MRILLVSPSYYGYDHAISRALEALGHEVLSLGFFPHLTLGEKVQNRIVDEVLPRVGVSGPRDTKRARFNASVLEHAASFRPNIAIVVKGDVLVPETVESLAKACPLAHWAFDDPYRYENVVASLGAYRAIGSFSHADTERLVADRYPAFYLPDGYDSFTFGASDSVRSEWAFDVGFLGARYPEREHVLDRLVPRFTLGIWGGDWKRRPWRARYYQPRSMLDACCRGAAGPGAADIIYRSVAVNLNIHGSWDGLNMRVFEIPGAGGYQLCDSRRGLAEAFEPGVELDVYHNSDSMMELCEAAVGDSRRRARIAAAGRARASAEHTLVHRMQTLIGVMARD
ncbi:MAG: glycosyltransferase [Coriobacteriia bacterium]|nr:glycosyltransferase [Coriobacteriia bacterium]